MLSCAAYILAMDTFGPITDNAGGIIEMSNQPDSIRERTDKLDSAGNTTKALTKGYAVGSASLAAFLLFSAYLEEIKVIVTAKVANAGGYMPAGWSFTNINLAQVPVFVGALLGATLTFLFSSMAIKAVGRTAQMVVQDVREQFKENPGIMAGTSKPDYGRCVHIVTGAALKEMVLPGAVGGWSAGGGWVDLPALQCELPGECGDLCAGDDFAGAGDWRRAGESCRRGSCRWIADGRDDCGRAAGDADEQRRRRVGQCEEVHRDRTVRRKEVGGAQGGGGGRHGRRSVQGHGGTESACADQVAGYDYAGAGSVVCLDWKMFWMGGHVVAHFQAVL